jgi:sortase (surface protein transpeptidase)
MLVLAGIGMAADAAWTAVRGSADSSATVPGTVSTAPPPTSAALPPTSAALPPASASPQEPGMPTSVPVRIVIPAIGVDAPLIRVGQVGHSVGVPPLGDLNLAGWFDRTVTPGQNGPSLIDGHVDSYAGPSVFFNLKNLKPADQIRVLGADGTTAVFRVTWVQIVAKAAFPWHTVLGPTSYPALRLVTCGGPFDSLTGHYIDNIIVYAAIGST